jgi:hypothetical protein
LSASLPVAAPELVLVRPQHQCSATDLDLCLSDTYAYLAPLRVEQDQRDFDGWFLLDCFPDLRGRRG